MEKDWYGNCRLCPRECGADRRKQPGYCRSSDVVQAARAGLHFYEEPFLSGTRGSGTVFFSGCSLGCVYCQNRQISREGFGIPVSTERLAEIFLEQQDRKAHNLNLVTGTHFTPSIAAALRMAKAQGLCIPVVWNSSGYEKPETLRMLEGLVDIFLPDFKTMSPQLGMDYMHASDYPDRAKEALSCMVQMSGSAVFEAFASEPVQYEGEGVLMKRGVVVRHLVIPGRVRDTKDVLSYLYETYGSRIWISLMNQYTPPTDHRRQMEGYKELQRPLYSEEYDEAVDFAIELGIENCMIQEGETASESFIPLFDGTGIL